MADDRDGPAAWADLAPLVASSPPPEQPDAKPAVATAVPGLAPAAMPLASGSNRSHAGQGHQQQQQQKRRTIYPPVDLASLGGPSTAAGGSSNIGGRRASSSSTTSGQHQLKPTTMAAGVKPEPASTADQLLSFSPSPPRFHPDDASASTSSGPVKREPSDDEIEVVGVSSRPQTASSRAAAAAVAAVAAQAAYDDGDEIEELDRPVAGPSRTHGGSGRGDGLDFQARQAERQKGFGQLAALDEEITSVENQLEALQTLAQSLYAERAALAESLAAPTPRARAPAANAHASGGGGGAGGRGIDYTDGSQFEWAVELRRTARDVFGIEAFRLCQEGVCNANMDARDAVAIMPTGGGKSLCYQLPALLSPGTTVGTEGTHTVISPLLSLITDQILHLQAQGIACAQLTGAVDKADQRRLLSRLVAGSGPLPGNGHGGGRKGKGSGGGGGYRLDPKGLKGGDRGFRGRGFGKKKKKGKGKREEESDEDDDDLFAGDGDDDEDERELKLLYCTPEKIARSKLLGSTLQKMHTVGTLARIVIDEAHCVSQMGHDFRPDYKKLSILRQLYPGVPILAVTATCSRKVLPDLLQTLGMKPVTAANDANGDGTVFFDAPLYRPNLQYKVLPKTAKGKELVEDMADYIKREHRDDSGIVYCLSRKDAEDVAAGLKQQGVRTGVYHADVDDGEKQQLHRRWREGSVKVVVATIAFGLGIDKGDVRFVLHHSISKSLDGYYQETGRAGRDGKDADCVLFYRAQDVSRMAGLTMADSESSGKLHDVVAFAQDIQTCRKTLFGRYFSTSASLPSKAWSEEEEPCGHCDNCTRDQSSLEIVDCTLAAWKICRVAQHVQANSGRTTLSALGDLVRGLGGGSFDTVVARGKKRQRAKLANVKETIDLDEVCGGKLAMSREDTERLIINLLLNEHGAYLEESYSQTAYTVNVYLQASSRALRLTRLDEGAVASSAIQVECAFPRKARSTTKKAAAKDGKGKVPVKGGNKSQTSPTVLEVSSGDEDDDDMGDFIADDASADDDDRFDYPRKGHSDDDSDDDVEDAGSPADFSGLSLFKRPKRAAPEKAAARPPSDDDDDDDEWEAFDQAALWDVSVVPREGISRGVAGGESSRGGAGAGGGGSSSARKDRGWRVVADETSEDKSEDGDVMIM